MIQPHCMGLPFPKRDTDSPGITWVLTKAGNWAKLPSGADLDAVAEEQRVKEKTSAQIPNR